MRAGQRVNAQRMHAQRMHESLSREMHAEFADMQVKASFDPIRFI